MKNFGEHLSRILASRGKSQKWLAEELGVSRQHINNYIKNRNLPPADLLPKMAKLLQVDLNMLAAGVTAGNDSIIEENIRLREEVKRLQEKEAEITKALLKLINDKK
jgi:transcriptional regulator with XRE-family HTH domain